MERYSLVLGDQVFQSAQVFRHDVLGAVPSVLERT